MKNRRPLKTIKMTTVTVSDLRELRMSRAVKTTDSTAPRYDYAMITLTLEWNGAN